MEADQRKVAIVTFLGKKYSGYVDVPNANFRTTDLLNSANIYWKNPNERDNLRIWTGVSLSFFKLRPTATVKASMARAKAVVTIRMKVIFNQPKFR